jgi:hypothetical protein
MRHLIAIQEIPLESESEVEDRCHQMPVRGRRFQADQQKLGVKIISNLIYTWLNGEMRFDARKMLSLYVPLR